MDSKSFPAFVSEAYTNTSYTALFVYAKKSYNCCYTFTHWTLLNKKWSIMHVIQVRQKVYTDFLNFCPIYFFTSPFVLCSAMECKSN